MESVVSEMFPSDGREDGMDEVEECGCKGKNLKTQAKNTKWAVMFQINTTWGWRVGWLWLDEWTEVQV